MKIYLIIQFLIIYNFTYSLAQVDVDKSTTAANNVDNLLKTLNSEQGYYDLAIGKVRRKALESNLETFKTELKSLPQYEIELDKVVEIDHNLESFNNAFSQISSKNTLDQDDIWALVNGWEKLEKIMGGIGIVNEGIIALPDLASGLLLSFMIKSYFEFAWNLAYASKCLETNVNIHDQIAEADQIINTKTLFTTSYDYGTFTLKNIPVFFDSTPKLATAFGIYSNSDPLFSDVLNFYLFFLFNTKQTDIVEAVTSIIEPTENGDRIISITDIDRAVFKHDKCPYLVKIPKEIMNYKNGKKFLLRLAIKRNTGSILLPKYEIEYAETEFSLNSNYDERDKLYNWNIYTSPFVPLADASPISSNSPTIDISISEGRYAIAIDFQSIFGNTPDRITIYEEDKILSGVYDIFVNINNEKYLLDINTKISNNITRFYKIFDFQPGEYDVSFETYSKGNKIIMPNQVDEEYKIIISEAEVDKVPKYNSEPMIVWDKTYGADNIDYYPILLPIEDNNILIAGNSLSGISGDKSENSKGVIDFWILKFNENREIIWDKTIGSLSIEWGTTITKAIDDGYIYGGYSRSYSEYGYNYRIIMVNKGGELLWDKTYGGFGNQFLTKVLPTENGYMLAGYTVESEASGNKTAEAIGGNDLWLVKIDQMGNVIWNKMIGSKDDDKGGYLVASPDEGYLLGSNTINSGVSGDKSQLSFGESDIWIIKLDKDGKILWDKSYGGNKNDVLTEIIPRDDGYLLIGHSNSAKSGNKYTNYTNGTWLINIDKDGNDVWQKNYGRQGIQLTRGFLDANGNYLLAGSYDEDTIPDNDCCVDYLITKIDPNGGIIWEKNIGGNDLDIATSIVPTPDGFLVGGHSNSNKSANKSEDSKGDFDYWIIKFKEKKQQSLILNPIGDKTYGDQEISINASYDSGLPITIEIVSGPGSIEGNVLTITGAGEITIKVSQVGNNEYLAAEDFYQTIKVNKAILKVIAADQTITYGDEIPDLTFTCQGFFNGDQKDVLDEEPVLNCEASSQSDAGEYPITLSGGADNNYSFEFISGTLTIEKTDQEISYTPLGEVYNDQEVVDIQATSSKGLEVFYEVISGPALVENNQIKLTGEPGVVEVKISQPGNNNYNAAAPVFISFEVKQVDPCFDFSLTVSSTINNSCAGFTEGSISLDVSGGTEPYRFDWSNGASDKDLKDLAAGSYQVEVSDSNCCEDSLKVTITEPDSLPKPLITAEGLGTGTVVLSSSEPSGNQWYLNEAIIDGAVQEDYIIASDGKYTVQVKNGECTGEMSDPYIITITDIGTNFSNSNVKVYPNPSQDRIDIDILVKTSDKVNIKLLSLDGSIVLNQKFNKNQSIVIDIKNLIKGIYLLRIEQNQNVLIRKVTIK